MERTTQSATKGYGALRKRFWSQHDISMKKSESLLGFGCTLPPLFHRIHHPISDTHQSSYPRTAPPPQYVLGIRWQDYFPHVEMLRIAQAVSAEALIATHQLSWAGHIRRMDKDRFPKIVLYCSELKSGKSSHEKEYEKRRSLI